MILATDLMPVCRAGMRQLFVVAGAVAFGFLLISCQVSPTLLTGKTMGTNYSITIAEPVAEGLHVEIKLGIEQVLAQVNASMSTYIPDSEISLFNRSRVTKWQPASAPLLEVLTAAQRISQLSDGAFDVTVGPAVNLWGFGHVPAPTKLPSDEEISEVLKRVGYQNLAVRPKRAMIKKTLADLHIDLSAIAKGYAVDQITQLLDTQGINNYLVEIGGELHANGVNSRGEVWRVGIENPDTLGSITQAVWLDNVAIATSGDYRNYQEFAGQKYSHGINPITGKPVIHRVASVSVIAQNAMQADAWATAFLVMGEERGLQLAKDLNVAAYFIIRGDSGFSNKWSDAFAAYFQSPQE